MAKPGATSFQKKARIKIGQIPGTRPSLHNNQLLISSGIPSLDVVVGTGLAVGSVILIEEDVYGNYAKLMLKYFAAEAVMSQQSLFLSSSDISTQQLIKELPAPVDDVSSRKSSGITSWAVQSSASTDGGKDQENQNGEKMKIAWRYQNSPKIQSTRTPVVKFGHYYDLTRTMSSDLTDRADIAFFPSPNNKQMFDAGCSIGMKPSYFHLLQDIKSRIQEGGFGTAQDLGQRRILRIGIHSLGSPLWGECGGMKPGTDSYDASLALFLVALRSLLRSAFAVAMVTFPVHLFRDKAYVKRIERLCDTVVRLESFAGSDREKNPVFKEYHGLLHVVQLPRLNSMVPPQSEVTDLAFKLHRKKFSVEKLHLPPEIPDSTGRSQENSLFSHATETIGCGFKASSKLDF